MFDAQKEIAKFRDAIARVEALPDDGFVLEVEGFYVNFNGGLFLGGLGFAAIYPLEAQARDARLDPEKIDDFLQKRFTKGQAKAIRAAHFTEEERPIETLWDVAVGATAYARGIKYQNERVEIEREAGKIIELASR